jgi:hypothetical protein
MVIGLFLSALSSKLHVSEYVITLPHFLYKKSFWFSVRKADKYILYGNK